MNFQFVTTREELQAIIDGSVERAFEKSGYSSQSTTNLSDAPVNTKEICNFLDVTEPTLIRWRKKGKIPFIQIGGRILYQKSKIIEALQQKRK